MVYFGEVQLAGSPGATGDARSMTIRMLAPEVAAQIAAGEVVERPASIVKELVENAIDAGASRITIDLQGGGLSVLRVTDNGCGIERDELPLAFARQATSKIGAIDDLDSLRTLGFRGEALASIGAVAEVTLASRTVAAPGGAQMEARQGVLTDVTTTAMPPGTIVTVRDLFAQVPARLKFMKSPQSEANHCIQHVQRYALAYPEIQFTVLNEGRLALRTPGDGQLDHAVAQVYDLRTAEQMVPLHYGDHHAEVEPAAQDDATRHANVDRPPTISGLTSRPAAFRSTRSHMVIFVNRRWVRSQALTYAIEEAYHSLLLTGRHPITIVNLTLDPSLVDVNVHPAKTEVKFARERQVYASVQRAVRAAVVDTTEAPALNDAAFSPQPDGAIPSTANEEATQEEISTPTPPLANSMPPAALARQQSPLWGRGELHQASRPSEQRTPVADVGITPRLPVLRVLGQISQSYIITEGPDGVYLIDQHAAHERILLEKMVAQWRAQQLPAQLLLEPIVVELDAESYSAVEEHLEDLRRLSFAIESFGVATMLVRAVPAPLAEHASADALRELLPELVGVDGAGHGETWEEHVLANVACKAAIRAGQSLSSDEQRALVRQLETVDARHSCCHGRPTTVHLSIEALERQFARR